MEGSKLNHSLLRKVGLSLFPVIIGVLAITGLFSLFAHSPVLAEPTESASTQDLWVGISSEPVALDPSRALDGNSYLVSSQIYETVVSYQPGGSIVEPGLATSWTVSVDGLTWDFTLNTGIQFHDGTNLDADAVVYNLERWWDPAHPYHTGDFEYFNYLFNGYKGDPGCLISDVLAIGDSQVRIVLSQPNSTLPNMLAIAQFSIASPAAIQAGTLMTEPVGSGPFKFSVWEGADHIALAENQNYWDGSPKLDNLYFKFIDTPEDRVNALKTGVIQVAEGMIGEDAVWAASDPNYHLMWHPEGALGYLGVNRGFSPLDELPVRQAIAHAVDKGQLLSNFYHPGTQTANQMLPEIMFGHLPDLVDYAYDPAQSLSLLSQAGHTDGVTVTLAWRDVYRYYLPDPEGTALGIETYLEAAGFNVTVVGYDSPTFFDKRNNGELELFLLGWGSDYLHPDNYFHYHFCGGGSAGFGPEDTVICDNLDAALETTDFEAQLAIYESVNQRVFDTLPLLPLVHIRRALISDYRVEGIVPSLLSQTSYKDAGFVEAAEEVIDPVTGGELVFTATETNTTTITIPGNAVSETVSIHFIPTEPGEPPVGFSFTNNSFSLEVYQDGVLQDGFVFQEPVMITIEYSEEDITGILEESMLLYYWDGSSWVDAASTCDPASTYTRDLVGNKLSTSICHLSHFSMMGESQELYLPLIMNGP